MPNKRKTPSIASDDGDDEYRSKRDRNNQVSFNWAPPLQHQLFLIVSVFFLYTYIVIVVN